MEGEGEGRGDWMKDRRKQIDISRLRYLTNVIAIIVIRLKPETQYL